MDAISYLRQFRVSGYAVFDLAAAVIGMCLLSPLLSRGCRKLGLEVPRLNWVYLALPIGMAAHLAVGKITPMTRDLFYLHGHYLLKVAMLALCILGLRNIRRIK